MIGNIIEYIFEHNFMPLLFMLPLLVVAQIIITMYRNKMSKAMNIYICLVLFMLFPLVFDIGLGSNTGTDSSAELGWLLFLTVPAGAIGILFYTIFLLVLFIAEQIKASMQRSKATKNEN